MKRLLVFICFISLHNLLLGQSNLDLVKAIDIQVKSIESNPKILPNLFIDSSKSSDPFTETFFINSNTSKLSKVEFLHFTPYVKITYYYYNNEFIKSAAIDKSTSMILNFCKYFKNGKMIYNCHPPVDGPNNGDLAIKKANEYLNRFNVEMHK